MIDGRALAHLRVLEVILVSGGGSVWHRQWLACLAVLGGIPMNADRLIKARLAFLDVPSNFPENPSPISLIQLRLASSKVRQGNPVSIGGWMEATLALVHDLRALQ